MIKCPYCGTDISQGPCQHVSGVEFYKTGEIKRVDFRAPQPVVSPLPPVQPLPDPIAPQPWKLPQIWVGDYPPFYGTITTGGTIPFMDQNKWIVS